jgi:DUF1680 family protein
MRINLSAFLAMLLLLPVPCLADAGGKLPFDFDPHARYKFGGVVGERIAANTDQWLVRAPTANPGLLAMFRLRDLQPTPQLVPWAGEFVGKYLLSAIQAQRMTENARLQATTAAVVKELIDSQAEDGYLGPFPRDERLLKHWDLWGHYHIIQALLAQHEQTGDPRALEACCRAADLVCQVYLDTERRMLAAGSDEMNLAIIHALGMLYRRSGQPRYLQMMREIEKDWEQAGDYLRTGLAGVEFYRTPRPRWESLHDLQGLVELYRITNDPRYRHALLHHWNSIRRWDRRNTGGFSSGEQATGTPYEPTAIETCCTIAWMALTVDALRLTGNPLAADELELSTYNAMLGAQHPSGSWWTYNTPMNGIREASHDTIVFQSRAGTPDLNCCSVNAPRGLGMLSEWAVMRGDGQLIINYLGPMQAKLDLDDKTSIAIEQRTTYPLDGKIQIVLRPQQPVPFQLKVRIPSWTKSAEVQLGQDPPTAVEGGQYVTITRRWQAGDTLLLSIDMPLRYETGDNEMAGRLSLYRGPLLLAYDFHQNETRDNQPPAISLANLAKARLSVPARTAGGEAFGRFAPWLLVDIPDDDRGWIRLCDFASAGSAGSHYASWLPATNLPPPRPLQQQPQDGASVPPGTMLLSMRRSSVLNNGSLHLEFSKSPEFKEIALQVQTNQGRRILLPKALTEKLEPNVDYYWRLVARNEHGETTSNLPAPRFRVDPDLPPLTQQDLAEYGERSDGVIIEADLHGVPDPQYGALAEAHGWKPAPGPEGQADNAIELDGKSGMLVYQLKAFPPEQYSVSFWLSPTKNEDRLGQAFSAWCRGMDDPLRISVEGGKLFARMEVGRGLSDSGTPVTAGTWYHVCVVKRGHLLLTFLNGQRVSEIQVPNEVRSAATDFALGGNPHYTGSSENLACRVVKFVMLARALTDEEVRQKFESQ